MSISIRHKSEFICHGTDLNAHWLHDITTIQQYKFWLSAHIYLLEDIFHHNNGIRGLIVKLLECMYDWVEQHTVLLLAWKRGNKMVITWLDNYKIQSEPRIGTESRRFYFNLLRQRRFFSPTPHNFQLIVMAFVYGYIVELRDHRVAK